MIVVDHASADPAAQHATEEDEHYARFKVPDDLIW